MKPYIKHKLKIFLGIFFLFGLLIIFGLQNNHKGDILMTEDVNQIFLVNSIIDGDTISVNYHGEEKQVRFLGIDTPEITTDHTEADCYSYESSAFTFSLLRNRQVYLRRDTINTDVDAQGRLLRYVDIPVGGNQYVRLNELLVREGYAKAVPEYPLSENERYEELENMARKEGKGIWKFCK